jgi:ribosomal-protein-serine acetyltransferase
VSDPGSKASRHPRPPARLETDRLVIRRPEPGDAPSIVDAIAESIAELRPWMPWAQKVPTLAEQEAHVLQAGRSFDAGEDFPLHLFEKASGTYLGGSGLHRFDWSVPRFEIGYWVRTSRVGRGYCTEAVRAIAAMAFEALGARRVEIHCNAENRASWRVAERAGFELEGVLRQMAREADGHLRDTRVYARVR